MGRGKQPADPTERALQAARECREATRSAHEAMKGLREAEVELRALLAEAREFAKTVVPAEVSRQLQDLGPATEAAMRVSVAKVTAEFDRLEAILLGTENDGKPSIEELITARTALDRTGTENGAGPGTATTCPYCGTLNNAHDPLDNTPGATPWRNDVMICTTCWKVAVCDTSPIGKLTVRTPTREEAARFAKNVELQRSITEMRHTSVLLGRSLPIVDDGG